MDPKREFDVTFEFKSIKHSFFLIWFRHFSFCFNKTKPTPFHFRNKQKPYSNISLLVEWVISSNELLLCKLEQFEWLPKVLDKCKMSTIITCLLCECVKISLAISIVALSTFELTFPINILESDTFIGCACVHCGFR